MVYFMSSSSRVINQNIVSFNRRIIDLIIGSSVCLKSVKDSNQLISVLAGHNFIPKDPESFESLLCECGYYHISGYRRVFLDSYESNSWAGKYDQGVTEDSVIALIKFDKQISSTLIRSINIIERRIKSRAAYFLSQAMSEDFYLDKQNFQNSNNQTQSGFWNNFIYRSYSKVLENGSRELNPIIRHHIRTYDAKLPVWVLFEHISFGDFIKFMENLRNSIKNVTFENIFDSNKTQYRVLEFMSKDVILDMLTIVKLVRNRLAHLGRIYDWNFHYTINAKSFTSKYDSLFNTTTDDYNLHDIIDVIGFFILKEDYLALDNEIKGIVEQIKKEIPKPYCDRIITLMGYR
ncbi:MAG: putative abortive infection bacteriophage resistance protein [Erysipelotrichaceae bacterium]|nr:MAG: putative abortive infection bacteriophage resistance protein [Erysipelotrichaceae bacterium]